MINEKTCKLYLTKILLKRPVITVFVVYIFLLIFLNTFGYFSYENQSLLYNLGKNNSIVTVEGKIISVPFTLKHKKRFILKTNTVNKRTIREKIIVNLPSAYSVSYGDIIMVSGKLKTPFSAYFPLTFDYQEYLARNKIYTTLDTFSFEYIKSKPNIVKKFAIMFQLDISNKIDSYFKRPGSDILKSLVIGDKNSLTTDIKTAFSDSGVMHVLVVSGLHIGFIGIVVLFILKLTGLSFKTTSLLSIPLIFFYTIATGANPPALRSAIMFSCIIFSLALDREPLIYNSLALSALIILGFQPQQLFTASFQMSYGATIGIVCFYKHIFKLFKNVKNKILHFFCGVLSVTISAQIILIPVCMYYFGKISIVSFLANVIVVPTIGIILYFGVTFYILTFTFQCIAISCSIVLSWLLNFVLFVTISLGNFKFASVNVAKPTVAQLSFFFLLLFCITHFKNKKRFITSGIILMLSTGYSIYPILHQKNKISFNIYNGNNITTFHIKNNSKNMFVLYNKTKYNMYYDKYYINSFGQFITYSGLKNINIKIVGLNKEKICSDLTNFNIDTIKNTEGTSEEVFDFNFDDHPIRINFNIGKFYIDNVEFSLKDNTSFFYNTKGYNKK